MACINLFAGGNIRGMTIDELISAAGSIGRLAEIAGVDRTSIAASWKRAGRVPAARAHAISAALGIPLHEIRPDLWHEATHTTTVGAAP